MTVSKEGHHRQSDLTYTFSIPTTFLRVLNITRIDISGAAQASFNAAIFGVSRCIDYILTDNCTVLKNRGIKIAVLYATYIPITDYTYMTYVKSFAPKIPQALQSCASPGIFFQVGPDQGIRRPWRRCFPS